ncbi:hypothetical protein O181_062572 [Austropuccinia psidii MF-1]|uniref:Major facilitator superfamily (MFS) profile domain-containing protein n=1 Tax=Austropuccinia psidii MF-1 TaxID=1389203 RepID=A0A9Q3ESE4_9BASI|nr:hypothetical protein [Austropuccinia psidii MF-1]
MKTSLWYVGLLVEKFWKSLKTNSFFQETGLSCAISYHRSFTFAWIMVWLMWKNSRYQDPSRLPLLDSNGQPNQSQSQADQQDVGADLSTPLPYRQLLVLCLMRITEPISQGLIQPFINQMLEDLKVTPDRTQIGFYAGLITSLFAFCQLCTTFWWGTLSDRIGRKPILICGLIGLASSIISFGLQKSFVGLVIARCFAGIMNGNIAVVKSVLAECTDETNKARAFVLLPTSNALGMIIGPMIGGYLAQPAQQYPGLFGHNRFLLSNPYFLPCFIAGLSNLSAAVLGFFYLEETLKSKKAVNTFSTSIERIDTSHSETESDAQEPQRKFTSLFSPMVVSVLSGSLLVYFQISSWTTLIPMFAYTRVEDGGLGLSLNQIGTALSTDGLVSIVVQIIVFPYVQRRWGTLNVFKAVLLTWPVAFGLLPCVRWLMIQKGKQFGEEAASQIALFALIAVLAIKSFGQMTMVCVSLLINSAAPSPSTFGALNGLGQSCSALARTFAPIITGTLFSMSIDKHKHYLGGNLIFIATVFVSILTSFVAQTIRTKSDRINQKSKNVVGQL